MSEPEFNARGVRIERWPRSLTKAGQVLIQDGRLALLTSYGRVIDSAPVRAVRADRSWFSGRGSMVATLNGTRYRLTMGQRGHRPGGHTSDGSRPDATALAGRLLDAVRRAGAPQS
ncbi:hypothetical protein [Streptomyces sp. NPDC088725]|uniref:hypothetical protein n=1 Tax=Streptomyces sp. NPDC088725 TaxID=3365873 RepID=UPI00381E0D1B